MSPTGVLSYSVAKRKLLAFEAAEIHMPEDVVFMLCSTFFLPSLLHHRAFANSPAYLSILYPSEFVDTLLAPTDMQGTQF